MLEQSSQHGKRKGRRRRREREKVVLRSSRIRRGGDNTVNGHRITLLLEEDLTRMSNERPRVSSET